MNPFRYQKVKDTGSLNVKALKISLLLRWRLHYLILLLKLLLQLCNPDYCHLQVVRLFRLFGCEKHYSGFTKTNLFLLTRNCRASITHSAYVVPLLLTFCRLWNLLFSYMQLYSGSCVVTNEYWTAPLKFEFLRQSLKIWISFYGH